jgi:hypothetical protein
MEKERNFLLNIFQMFSNLMTKLQEMAPEADLDPKHPTTKDTPGVGVSTWAGVPYLAALSQSFSLVAEVLVLSSLPLLSYNSEQVAIQQLRYLVGASEFGPLASMSFVREAHSERIPEIPLLMLNSR